MTNASPPPLPPLPPPPPPPPDGLALPPQSNVKVCINITNRSLALKFREKKMKNKVMHYKYVLLKLTLFKPIGVSIIAYKNPLHKPIVAIKTYDIERTTSGHFIHSSCWRFRFPAPSTAAVVSAAGYYPPRAARRSVIRRIFIRWSSVTVMIRPVHVHRGTS